MRKQDTTECKLPNPVPCGCGKGYLLPLLRPAPIYRFSGPPGVEVGANEVIWKCSSCDKVVKW